ncbi:MAG: hypothetical protein AAFU65_06820, partial [Pseudomonadota bacterium]
MIEVRQADSKTLFLRGPAPGTRCLLLLVISVALMFSDFRYGHLESVRQGLASVVYPLRAMVDAPFRAAAGVKEQFAEVPKGRDEFAVLSHEGQPATYAKTHNRRIDLELTAVRVALAAQRDVAVEAVIPVCPERFLQIEIPRPVGPGEAHGESNPGNLKVRGAENELALLGTDHS